MPSERPRATPLWMSLLAWAYTRACERRHMCCERACVSVHVCVPQASPWSHAHLFCCLRSPSQTGLLFGLFTQRKGQRNWPPALQDLNARTPAGAPRAASLGRDVAGRDGPGTCRETGKQLFPASLMWGPQGVQPGHCFVPTPLALEERIP